jgi:hypothetical protein
VFDKRASQISGRRTFYSLFARNHNKNTTNYLIN